MLGTVGRYTNHSTAGGLSQWTVRSGHRLHVASAGGTEISTGRWTVRMRCNGKISLKYHNRHSF